MLISLKKKNTHFTSKGNLKFKALLSLMKQLNVDFTRISDHRDVDTPNLRDVDFT